MKLGTQKKLAAKILKCSEKKVVFDSESLEDIKEAITKADIKILIANKVIRKKREQGIAKGRTRKKHSQQKKGRRRGEGKRKGKTKARTPKKADWMNKIRLQRKFLKELKEKGLFEPDIYRSLYKKAKGGFFRSKNHIKIYISDNKLIKGK